MFIAALFTITKIWKQPKSISRWVGKRVMGHLHNGILLLSYKKKDEEEIFTLWNSMEDLENIMLSEISQSEKDKCHRISLIGGMWNLMKKLN